MGDRYNILEAETVLNSLSQLIHNTRGFVFTSIALGELVLSDFGPACRIAVIRQPLLMQKAMVSVPF